ncbi:hypothetical protein [Rhizobium rhizosphaerae]|uniref:hypothetical protein n=1 Tax=Xaviernesmea rhizosphaerae TaxID=1672749 RepID=UPI00117BDB63|nr:hypothetical protein [Xaviernesmea rhizosphaerae]
MIERSTESPQRISLEYRTEKWEPLFGEIRCKNEIPEHRTASFYRSDGLAPLEKQSSDASRQIRQPGVENYRAEAVSRQWVQIRLSNHYFVPISDTWYQAGV